MVRAGLMSGQCGLLSLLSRTTSMTGPMDYLHLVVSVARYFLSTRKHQVSKILFRGTRKQVPLFENSLNEPLEQEY